MARKQSHVRQQKQKFKIYGPYRRKEKWIVRVRTWEGEKPIETSESFSSEQAALEHRAALEEELDAMRAYERAAELQRLAEEALAQAQSLDYRSRTVKEAMDEFELYLRRKGNKPKSITTSCHRLKGILGPVMNAAVQGITIRRANDLYEKRVESRSAATHRGELAAARHMWRWLGEERWVLSNPWSEVKPVGRVNAGKPQLRGHEARKLAGLALARASGDLAPGQFVKFKRRGALGVLVALYFALREGEILHLLGRDIDPDTGELYIEEGKTENAQRRLTAPEPIRDLLKQRAREVGQMGRLFPHDKGWVLKHTKKLCDLAGVPTVCAHSLRGLHATLATEAGATGELVAAQLGHSSPKVTAQHYTARGAIRTARQRGVLRVLDGGQ